MMNNVQYLLTKLAEECVEVAQMAHKCQQFGMYEKQPGNPKSNVQRLHDELNDVMGIIQLLNDEECFSFLPSEEAIANKIQKVYHYRHYSKTIGEVE